MAKAAQILRTARLTQGCSQRELAARAGFPQSTVARIESGQRDPAITTMERCLSAAGHRLVAIPTTRGTAADAAEGVATALADRNDGRAFRMLIQLCDDLGAEHALLRGVLCLSEPRLTGNARYDAFIAAAVEHYLARENLPVPEWTSQARRFVRPLWFVAGIPGFEADAYRTAPASFVRHGVMVNASELASV